MSEQWHSNPLVLLLEEAARLLEIARRREKDTVVDAREGVEFHKSVDKWFENFGVDPDPKTRYDNPEYQRWLQWREQVLKL